MINFKENGVISEKGKIAHILSLFLQILLKSIPCMEAKKNRHEK